MPDGKKSGLEDAVRVLGGVDGISIVYLSDKDVVRNPLVMSIVKAYDADDKRRKKIDEHEINQ